MTVVLYSLGGSVFAWRVQLALEHKGIAHEVKNRGTPPSEGYLAMNPRGKVPVLRDGDFTLYESTAILEYLDEKYPETRKIYPMDVGERARVRRIISATTGGWTIFPSATRLDSLRNTIAPRAARSSAPVSSIICSPNSCASSLNIGWPGACSSRTMASASTSVAPSSASIALTVLLPDPIPPESPSTKVIATA